MAPPTGIDRTVRIPPPQSGNSGASPRHGRRQRPHVSVRQPAM